MPLLLALIGFGLAIFFAALVWKLTREERSRSAARVSALADAIDAATVSGPVEQVDVQPTFLAQDRPVASPRGGLIKLAVGMAASVALIVAIAMMSSSTSQAQRSPATNAASTAGLKDGSIELLSMRHEREGDALTVTGLVRNGGSAPAQRLIAVIFTFDRNGNFVASGRAPLEFISLAPGDESPFRVSVPNAGDVGRYRVSFRTEAGVVRHVDRRQALVARRSE
jgi:hypothetical protein